MGFIKSLCCVFQPADGCSACRWLVKINCFLYFSVTKVKNKEKQIGKPPLNCNKRGDLPAFSCYSLTLVDTQKLVDSWGKCDFSLLSQGVDQCLRDPFLCMFFCFIFVLSFLFSFFFFH